LVTALVSTGAFYLIAEKALIAAKEARAAFRGY
jgi:hypothetical protein